MDFNIETLSNALVAFFMANPLIGAILVGVVAVFIFIDSMWLSYDNAALALDTRGEVRGPEMAIWSGNDIINRFIMGLFRRHLYRKWKRNKKRIERQRTKETNYGGK